jgi:endonuclease-3
MGAWSDKFSKETPDRRKERAKKILARLGKAYGPVPCALHFSSPLELLVAVILSAQCTDKRVNLVTPALFKKYRSAGDYAKARLETFQEEIRSTGFYKNKAKSIIHCAKAIAEQHGGKVPDRLEELVKLPGVGRKTANAVLGNAFGIPGLCVDTHMIRVNQKLGLTKDTDPVKIEFNLMKIVPEKEWTNWSNLIIHHGRVRCFARKPDCANCSINDLCPSREDL